jgi:hypothetical protein
MRLVVEVISIGGGLRDILGAFCSSIAFSAPVVSLSVSVVLRGAKKLRVNTALGGRFRATDVGIGLVEFLAACEVSLEVYLLRLFTSWKSSSWSVDSTEVLFTAPLRPACALTFRTAFSLFSVNHVYAVKIAKNRPSI